MSIPNLQDKYVLVTGAASGIGRATALAFAAQGANLFIADIDRIALESLCADITAGGAVCIAHVTDVSDSQAMRQLADAVHAVVPALDVLVNNAGIAYLGSFAETSLATWDRMLQVNLMGVVHSCQSFLPQMRHAGGPRHILNVASLAGISPPPNVSAYAASKFAVMGLCEVLALELAGSGVRVSAVCPGVVDTAITQGKRGASISDAQVARLRAYYKKHGGPPEEVAAAIVNAVRRGHDLVLAGPYAQLMYQIKRLSRALAHRLNLVAAVNSGYL
ncbi:MAG: SDR family NAD(P)-dependent oxidoreductase [Pseudomonadota bacterium]